MVINSSNMYRYTVQYYEGIVKPPSNFLLVTIIILEKRQHKIGIHISESIHNINLTQTTRNSSTYMMEKLQMDTSRPVLKSNSFGLSLFTLEVVLLVSDLSNAIWQALIGEPPV